MALGVRHNFDQIMDWLAVYEGGYVNHPRDPGGATNRGVTQRVYDAYRRNKGRPLQSVRHISDGEHDEIYLRQYWQPIRGDDLPDGLDATMFDFAVNSGVSRAARTLQRSLGVTADGIIGEITLSAVYERVNRGALIDLIVDVNNRRMSFLRRLSTFDVFGKGWTRRVVGDQPGVQAGDIGVVDRSVYLARDDMANASIPRPKRAAQGKADERSMRRSGRLADALGGLWGALFGGRRAGAT